MTVGHVAMATRSRLGRHRLEKHPGATSWPPSSRADAASPCSLPSVRSWRVACVEARHADAMGRLLRPPPRCAGRRSASRGGTLYRTPHAPRHAPMKVQKPLRSTDIKGRQHSLLRSRTCLPSCHAPTCHLPSCAGTPSWHPASPAARALVHRPCLALANPLSTEAFP